MSSPMTDHWLLMGSLWNPFIITSLYLVTVLILPFLITNERLAKLADSLRNATVITLAAVNIALTGCFMYGSSKLNYSPWCEPSSKASLSPDSWRWLKFWEDADAYQSTELIVAVGLYVYFLTKIFEFVDHLVIILRNEEVEESDIAHHMIMVWLSWVGVKYAPGGSTAIWVLINCTFLAIAYTFHSLRFFFQSSKKLEERWDGIKPILRFFKNLHFLATGVHALTVIIHPDCGYPKQYAWSLLIFVAGIVLIPFLFGSNSGAAPPAGGGGNGDGGIANPVEQSDQRPSDGGGGDGGNGGNSQPPPPAYEAPLPPPNPGLVRRAAPPARPVHPVNYNPRDWELRPFP